MELILKHESTEDIVFRNYWLLVDHYLVLCILLVMTLTNLLVFCRYRHCKFDRLYVFVILAYNVVYLDEAVIASIHIKN